MSLSRRISCSCILEKANRPFLFLIIFAGMVAFSLVSCKKDNKDQPLNKEVIIIGIYDGMSVDSTEQVIEASYNDFEEIVLDPDHNGELDLRLLVAVYGSPGMGIHNISTLQALNASIALYGATSEDTTFLYRKTGVYEDDYNIYKSVTDYYSCRQKTADYIALSHETAFHLLDLEYNDKLSVSDQFATDSASFIYHWGYPPMSFYENDTVYVQSSSYEFDCHTLPYGKEIYLGFQVRGETTRLGWLKLILVSEDKIALKEYTLQQ